MATRFQQFKKTRFGAIHFWLPQAGWRVDVMENPTKIWVIWGHPYFSKPPYPFIVWFSMGWQYINIWSLTCYPKIIQTRRWFWDTSTLKPMIFGHSSFEKPHMTETIKWGCNLYKNEDGIIFHVSTSWTFNMYEFCWILGFPEIGLPPVIIHLEWDFP